MPNMFITICLAFAAMANADENDRLTLLSPKTTVAARWPAFLRHYSKVYTSPSDQAARQKIFNDNDAFIRSTNAGQKSFTLSHNRFSDMNKEEYRNKMLGGLNFAEAKNRTLRHESSTVLKAMSLAAPASIDWVQKGAVTPAKNQGQCGSCWTFGATGALEGAYFVENGGAQISLSEQELVSCSTQGNGCQGGLPDIAFDYIEQNGLCLEADYPYVSGTTEEDESCERTCRSAIKVTGYTDVPRGDEDALMAAVATRPVAVGIEADAQEFQFYSEGVMDFDCGKKLDHAVLAVGYGTTYVQDGQDYWKVKNSWGDSWGIEGFFLMARGKDMCGVTTMPSYPTGVTSTGGHNPTPTPTPHPTPSPSPSPFSPTPSPSPSPFSPTPAPASHNICVPRPGTEKEGCNVCEECCGVFMDEGEDCDRCVDLLCPSPAPAPAPAPTPTPAPAPSQLVCDPTKGCDGVCDTCCKSYLLNEGDCGQCIASECKAPAPKPVCDPAVGCTGSCGVCCKSYLKDEVDCGSCVAQECTAPVPKPVCDPAAGCIFSCTACCKSYLKDEGDCGKCVATSCTSNLRATVSSILALM